MIKEIVKQWEENKHKLEKYFKENEQSKYCNYPTIVKLIFDLCIEGFDTNKMTVIDDGDYQGTKIYIIPKDTYQPSRSEYIVTDNYYDDCPSDDQVRDYMMIALHLVQAMEWL